MARIAASHALFSLHRKPDLSLLFNEACHRIATRLLISWRSFLWLDDEQNLQERSSRWRESRAAEKLHKHQDSIRFSQPTVIGCFIPENQVALPSESGFGQYCSTIQQNRLRRKRKLFLFSPLAASTWTM